MIQKDNRHQCPQICHRTTETGPCTTLMDDTLTHLLDCQKGPWSVRRHDAIRDCWKLLIATATGLEPQAEQLLPVPAVRASGSQEPETRKADLVIPTTGAPTYLDCVVTSPLAPSWMRRLNTVHITGAAAAHAERTKHVRYHPNPVTPLALEVFGRHGEEAIQFMQRLKRTADALGNDFNTGEAYQALSLTLQRANAINILTHINHTTAPQAADAVPANPAPATNPAPSGAAAPAPGNPAGEAQQAAASSSQAPAAAGADRAHVTQPVPGTPR